MAKANVSTETLVIDNREIVLIGVSGGSGGFGICDTTRNRSKGIKETFFIGQEAMINTLQKSINDDCSSKLIWQSSTIDKCAEFQKKVQQCCDVYYNDNQSMTASIYPFLEFLKNGLYIAYEAEMIPTDGAGNFFWNSYLMPHEFTGSSTFSPIYKKNENAAPCFMIPTESVSFFSENATRLESDKQKKGAEPGGICFHITGMFSALLTSHHAVAACILNGGVFKSIIIEQVRNVLFRDELNDPSVIEKSKNYGADYFYTQAVKIPIAKIPRSMLETFFTVRASDIPKSFNAVRINSEKSSRIKSKRALPPWITERCEALPDSEMVQSAVIIKSLSEPEIETLLKGETKLGDKIIISSNYYQSVTLACNYLQYKNYPRFISFVSSILKNKDLSAMHQYIANRLQNIINDDFEALFSEILADEDPVYTPIKPLAKKYLSRVKALKDKSELPGDGDSDGVGQFKVLKRDTDQEITALEMAKKLQQYNNKQKK